MRASISPRLRLKAVADSCPTKSQMNTLTSTSKPKPQVKPDDRILKVFRFRYTKECRDIRSPICKQVKAAPQFRLGTSHRTAEPTEFARFHEIMRDFESSQKKLIAPLFRSHGTEIRLLYHNSRKKRAFRGFSCDSGLSLSKEMRIMHK